MNFHPVANIFPMMSAEEFTALKADIQANGQLEPIWTHDNQIVDGRNRYNACEALGIEPAFREWNGEGSLVAFVVSLNLKRRHLSSSQKAVIALDIEKLFADEAKKRNGGRPSKNGEKPTQKFASVSDRDKRSAAGQAAEIMVTNRRYIGMAKKLAEKAPDILSLVRDGKLSMMDANQLSRRHQQKTLDAIVKKIETGEARNVNDARRKIHREQDLNFKQRCYVAMESNPELEVFKAALEADEVEALINGFNNKHFLGVRVKDLTKPLSGQTWDWPKYTGATFGRVDDYEMPNKDLDVPLFSEQEWEEFAFMDERAVLQALDFPAAKWMQWGDGMAGIPWRSNALRSAWSPNGRNRRDYDPAYGRHIVEGGDDCMLSKGGRMFVRQGWGRWFIAEYNDGNGGREKRRFFVHDHCDSTLIQQAVETVNPLAFSSTNLRRLQANVFRAMPAEASWAYFRYKTISRDEAIAALEADLETLRNAKQLTDDELNERILDWLQAFTPADSFQWREGECTYPRLLDGSIDRDRLRSMSQDA